MSLRTSLLSRIDRIRGIPGQLGLRQYSVMVRVRTWSGARVGLGTKTDTDTYVYTGAGTQNVKVSQLTTKDIVSSGGLYSDGDYKVGPMTPLNLGTGVDLATVDPATSSSPTEVFFKIVGPGFPAAGQWCERISDDTTPNFHHYIVLRARATVP